MRKTQFEGVKTVPHRKPNSPHLPSPPKKQFELIYRERDPEHAEQPYESIIFMKSKKCEQKISSKQKGQNRQKNGAVQEIAEMVANIQKQFKSQKQKQRKMQESSKENLMKAAPVSAKNLFKNKQIKETFHSKASSRWTKYKKQEILSTDNVRKYKNILSPSRSIKPKEGQTVSSKFLKSTQETFRKEAKPRDKKKAKPSISYNVATSSEPQEYILLENNFVELTTEDANLLHLKINSNKQVPQNIKKTQVIYNCGSQFQESQGWCSQLINDQQSDQQLSENEQEEAYCGRNMEVMQRYIACKARIIQRWWRSVLLKRNRQLDPIVFQQPKEAQELDESMVFIRNNLTKELQSSEVSPIKMIETFNIMDQQQADRPVEQQPKDPFDQRQSAAQEQLQTHLQLLDALLTARKITSEVYFQKKMLIEAKYQHEMQTIHQLKKIMQESTQRAYEIARKTQEDRIALESIPAEIDEKTLDHIFGKEFCSQEETNGNSYSAMPANYEMVVVNREKSTGCHYDQEDNPKSSIYQKRPHEEEEYQEDFEDEDEEEEQEQAGQYCSPQAEYSSNFSQLLDEYKLREQVKLQIDRRAAIQMGAVAEQIPEQVRNEYIGIDTSLSSIHRFVLSFFKFYIFYYKDQFLRLINMPYGYNVEKRLKFLHGHEEEDEDCPEEDQNGIIYGLQTIISDQILDEFYEKIYDITLPISTAKRANFEFQKVHNRAVLDCFNEALNFFRPYFLINGPPYPWNTSEKALTFYFIAEENIQEVFEKSQYRVLKWASSLCGIIVNKYQSPCGQIDPQMSIEDVLEIYKKACHPDLAETREERLAKNQKAEILEGSHEWSNFQEHVTITQLQNSEHVFTTLVEEFVLEFLLKQMQQTAKAAQPGSLDFFQQLTDEEFEQYC